MKPIFILFYSFSLLTCEQKSVKNLKESKSFIGQWKLYQTSGSDGAKAYESKVDYNLTYIFGNKNKFSELRELEKREGKYKIIPDQILEISKDKDTIYYKFNLEKSRLILNQVNKEGQIICDEGCSETYKKIN